VATEASPAQKRFWLLHEMADHAGALTLPLAFELHGEVDIDRLDEAVAGVVARHEALRTTFDEVDGLLHQRVGDRRTGVEYLDLCGEDVDLAAAVEMFLQDNDSRPFDLLDGPVFGARLVRLEPARWLFLVAAHHIAVDAWSLRVVLQEIGALYAGTALPVARQYREAVAAHEQWGESAEAVAEIAHWRALLDGAPDPVPLPGAPRRPFRRTYAIDQIPIPLDQRLMSAVDALAVSSRASRFVVLLAALSRFWERATGTTDLVIGTPGGGRPAWQDESVVGPMINTVLLRLRTDPDAPFRDAVGRARSVTFEALDHDRVPFDRVVSSLSPRRTTSHSPLCQVMLMTQEPIGTALSLPGLDVRVVPRPSQLTSDLDLTFLVDVEGTGAVLEYATDLYTAEEAATLAADFAAVLAESVADPDGLAGLAGFPPDHDVRSEARQTHFTPADAVSLPELVAAAGILLSRHGGGTEPVLGVDGRVVRLLLDDDPTFDDAVKRATEAMADGPAHDSFGVLITTGTRTDADITIAPAPGGLSWTCDVSRYEPSTVEALAGRLATLLRSGLAARSAPVSALDLLPAAEREAILRDARGPVLPIPPEGVAGLIAAHAAATPDRPAVRCGGVVMTYGELDAAAARLAARLGVAPGTTVGVCLDRSVDVVVALLALLKSGGVYVPLDPALPAARLAHVVEDAGIGVVVTTDELKGRVPVPEVVLADGLEATTPSPLVAPGPNDLAYVIYTSGSTGVPKGVAVEHRNLTNLVLRLAEDIGLTSDDRVLAATTLSFDMSLFELLGPLAAGACVEMAPQGAAADPDQLRDLVETSGATVIQATPSAWQNLLHAGWRGDPGVRALSGGEPLTDVLAKRLAERVGELWNVYGPTETTVWSTREKVDPDAITIGTPLANTSCYVLDEHQRLVPRGVTGELCIAGDGVARGYLNQPGLTAQRFLADEIGDHGRLYRTGDVARLRADGRFEVLGRKDRQVKLRGHRIELGEVESALARHPQVRQVGVVVTGDDVARQLVAFVVGEADEEQLAAVAAEQLPPYMVPSRYVTIDEMPLSSSGKLDYAALLSLKWTDEVKAGPLPRTETERRVAEVWREVLGVDDLRVTDDFLRLGGHSLSATMVMARLNDLCAVRLPMRAPFEASTLAELALLVDAAKDEGRTS
jgi:amino acid adenylation domain-containing protein